MATTASASPSSPVHKIPLEILLRITWHLTTPELGNLRLTSRHFLESLDTTFIKEFFTLKQFMMTDFSLQALIDISKSRLGPHLKRVHFGLDRFPENPHRNFGDTRQLARFKQLFSDQFTLWYTPCIHHLLKEAFQNLKNLEDVVIRDFNSRRRRRDGEYAHWTSYGSTTASQETGVPITQGSVGVWGSDLHVHYSSQVFTAVMNALGEAGARPRGIEFMSRNRSHVRDLAFNITKYNEPLVAPVLKNLEKLHLDVDLSPKGSYGFPGISMDDMNVVDPKFRQFLLRCTGVKHLRINENNSGQAPIGVLLEWLGHDSDASSQSPASLNQVLGLLPSDIPSPKLSNLEELNLGIMNVEASHILGVVRKFAPSLKRLELWKVTLQRRMPTDHSSPPPKINFWVKFLEKLKNIPGLNLHHIKVGMPQQQWITRAHKTRVQFQGTDNSMCIEYTGPDWKHFVDDMIPKINVQWTAQDEIRSPLDDEDEDDGVWDQYALDL